MNDPNNYPNCIDLTQFDEFHRNYQRENGRLEKEEQAFNHMFKDLSEAKKDIKPTQHVNIFLTIFNLNKKFRYLILNFRSLALDRIQLPLQQSGQKTWIWNWAKTWNKVEVVQVASFKIL